MAILEPGRVCRKTGGRDAGEYCAIIEPVDGGFTVENAASKKSKASGSHLEPTPWKVSVKNVKKELTDLKLA